MNSRHADHTWQRHRLRPLTATSQNRFIRTPLRNLNTGNHLVKQQNVSASGTFVSQKQMNVVRISWVFDTCCPTRYI